MRGGRDMSGLLKVCGLRMAGQVAILDGLGVDMLGFIFAGGSPRAVRPEEVAAMAKGKARRVGVFVEQSADEVRRVMDAAGLDLAQLHAGQDEEFCRQVGPERVIKVFWPQRYAVGCGIEEARAALERDMTRFADLCALVLLDAGMSGGGHGASLDFGSLAGLRAPRPWLLAGGLSPDNAALALEQAAPDGLDLNSGVETAPGVKDIERIERVMRLMKRT